MNKKIQVKLQVFLGILKDYRKASVHIRSKIEQI